MFNKLSFKDTTVKVGVESKQKDGMITQPEGIPIPCPLAF